MPRHPRFVGGAGLLSVLWHDSVEWMIAQGVDTFVEIGPGSVLSGLIKKIDKSVKVINVNSLDSVSSLETVV